MAKKKAPITSQETDVSPSAVLAADFDRSQLGEKTRVHQLAKQLGLMSKDLVVALDSIGLVKVAQSSLNLDEAHKLLDVLAKPVQDAPADAVPDVEPVEKIRRRVEKNVANEIHQIEEKVERELAEVAEPAAAVEALEVSELPNPEPEIEAVDLIAAAEAEMHAELLEDIIPEITPPPAEATIYAPIFVAPEMIPTEDIHDTDDTQVQERAARKRRGRRGTGRGRGPEVPQEVAEETSTSTVEAEEPEVVDEPVGIKGSTRLEAQRRRRTEMREEGRKKRHVVSTQEFMERRESMERRMIVRERHRHDNSGLVTQVGVMEDDLLVEQFVTSDAQSSMVGNIYLGRVQNVLPSMEAAFIDIGKGRNGVLYAGEVDWKAAGLGGRGRRIEQALKSGDKVLVQVTKDPLGHKGARLTTQISLAGRYLVYVPGGRSAGISRKLPGPERKRLKEILGRVVPPQGGTIIRTAAEGVSEENISADVNRLHTLWEQIQERTKVEKKSRNAQPVTMYEEPDMLVKVIRDLFNEDFTSLIVDGDRAWNTVRAYIQSVAPDLVSRVEHFERADFEGKDAFEAFDLNRQLEEALSRKVDLPSGGSLIIDKTEAMTVIDVNTGRYTGKGGGNLEETVTLNNIEAAEEIVRQMRLRDLGGMIVVDFIDMVLPENQELVLRRLNEALENDRTRHQVSEVTSLGLVQMTRKRIGAGLLETFSSECEHCEGRGLVIHQDPVDTVDARVEAKAEERTNRHKRNRESQKPVTDPAQHPMVVAMQDLVDDEEHDMDKEFEDLAASVILGDHSDSGDTVDTVEADEVVSTVEPEEGPRRRARRRRGKQQPVAETDSSHTISVGADDIAAIAAAAVDIANEEDPDEPSGSNYVADTIDVAVDERFFEDDHAVVEPAPEVRTSGGSTEGSVDGSSYQEALAEFEASPRRRRGTRGNSRSDHAPKREDFKSEPTRFSRGRKSVVEPAAAPVAEPAVVTEVQPASEQRAPQQDERKGDERSRRRRSRGRGLSQTPVVQQEEAAAVAEAATEEKASRRNRPSEVAASAPSTRPGRVRRRAVRRMSSDIEALDDAAPVAPSTPAVAAAPEVQESVEGQVSSPNRRRRRRAVRLASNSSSEVPAQRNSPASSEAQDAPRSELRNEPRKQNSGARRRRVTRKPQRG